jgi:hypothetical protein
MSYSGAGDIRESSAQLQRTPFIRFVARALRVCVCRSEYRGGAATRVRCACGMEGPRVRWMGRRALQRRERRGQRIGKSFSLV